MNRKGSMVVWVVAVVVIFLIGGIIWYVVSQGPAADHPATTSPVSSTTQSSASSSPQAASPSSTSWLSSIEQTSPLVISVPSSSSIPTEVQGKVAFMQDGDIWVANRDGSSPVQLTHTSGTVSTGEGDGGLFSFSPDFHYLAYYILWPAGTTAYASGTIAVLDLSDNQIVQKINGQTLDQFSVYRSLIGNDTPYVSFGKWINDSEFTYDAWGMGGGSGGMANEYGAVLVNVQTGTTTIQSSL